MKKITLMAALLGSAYFANAQVGIGTPTPEEAALLHIEAGNKGIIIPNVSLNSTSDTNTVVGAEVESLLVYNITTSADTTTKTAVTPGFYYWTTKSELDGSDVEGHWSRITTKAELDAAVGNVTNVQADLNKIKDLLQFAYPANNLDDDSSKDNLLAGGGMIFTPGADSNTVGKIEYVYFDSATGTYKKEVISAAQFGFKDKVTTLLFDSTTGQYTYKNELDSETVIDIPQTVIDNITNILGDTTTITVDSRTFTTVQEYLQYIVGNGEGNMTFVPGPDTGTTEEMLAGSSFIYTEPNGDTQTISFEALVQANETLTSLTGDSNTAIYTYTDEKGDTSTINIPVDVINNLNKIINTKTNIDSSTNITLVEYIQEMINDADKNLPAGTVTATADSDTVNFSIANGDGGFTPIEIGSFETIVKANETVTTLTGDSDIAIYTYTNENGDTSTINIPASVVNNFEKILDGVVTLQDGDTKTVETIIREISGSGAGNMTFIPGADSSTLLSEAKFQYVDNVTNTIVTKTFKELIQANETLTSLTGDSSTGEISYTPESGDTQTVDIVEMVVNNLDEIITSPTTIDSSTTTLVDYIQNMIDSSTVGGGNVYYGNVDSSTNVLYTQEGDSKTVIDVVSTVINNTTLTGDTNNDVAITNNINKLKNNLGTVLNGDSTTNTSVFTGDTYVENGVTYYIYKGVFATTVKAGTAVTTGISVDKAVKQILSISLIYNNGLTASVTDVSFATQAVSMNVGVGKMYNVLGTSDISAKVMVEFASAVKPAGL